MFYKKNSVTKLLLLTVYAIDGEGKLFLLHPRKPSGKNIIHRHVYHKTDKDLIKRTLHENILIY